LTDLSHIEPDEARRIIREAFQLNDCSHAMTARALRVSGGVLQLTIRLLGIRQELLDAEGRFLARFADPEKPVRSISRHRSPPRRHV